MPYIAKTYIRHNGTLYAPGDEIPAKRMNEETAEYHAANGRLELDGATEEVDPKKALLEENKAHTESLCREAGYPEEEWEKLNKEPLIDYYLAKQAKQE